MRHKNRKLYDAAGKRYVTLAQISELVARGESVRIHDQGTKSDVTVSVLALALADLVKSKAGSFPLPLMETLLRLAGGGSLETPRSAWNPRELALSAKAEAERIATGLVARGRVSLDDALHVKRDVERALESGLESIRSLSRKPFELRPGHAIRTLKDVGAELGAIDRLFSARPLLSHRLSSRKTRPAKIMRKPAKKRASAISQKVS